MLYKRGRFRSRKLIVCSQSLLPSVHHGQCWLARESTRSKGKSQIIRRRRARFLTQRRAQNSNLYDNPQRGPDGLYQPVEQVQPVNDGFIGGFDVRTAQPPSHHLQIPSFPSPVLPAANGYDSRPPTPPSKEGLNGMRYQQKSADYGRQISQQGTVSSTGSYGQSFMTRMSAVDRSQYLRAVRMNPYLQLMVGPLLRYDTVDERGVWHGACLIVCELDIQVCSCRLCSLCLIKLLMPVRTMSRIRPSHMNGILRLRKL